MEICPECYLTATNQYGKDNSHGLDEKDAQGKKLNKFRQTIFDRYKVGLSFDVELIFFLGN